MSNYYGQFTPSVDKFLHKRYFTDYGLGTCLECGAVDGIWYSSTKFFEETLKWKSINVEAHPESFKKLCENRPDSMNVHGALSNCEGTLLFKYSPQHTLRAKVAKEIEVSDESKRSKKWTYVEVPKTTYSKVIESANIDSLDLFVLDIEGAELEALENMMTCDILPKILVIENHVGKDNIQAIIGDLYNYDFSKRVNSFYVKK